MKHVTERPGPLRTRVEVIMKDGKIEGKIIVAYPKDGAGRTYGTLWDFENPCQNGSASGYGYDKVSAILCGMTFKGIVFEDHPHNYEEALKTAGYELRRLL